MRQPGGYIRLGVPPAAGQTLDGMAVVKLVGSAWTQLVRAKRSGSVALRFNRHWCFLSRIRRGNSGKRVPLDLTDCRGLMLAQLVPLAWTSRK